MRGSAMVVAALLLAVAWAGCLGGEEAGPGGSEGTPGSAPGSGDGQAGTGGQAPASLEAPTWSVGDWWRWTADGLGEYVYVVTGEEGQDWIVDTDNEQTAFFDALTDISFLGEVRKSDLAGSQNETRVEYFDWPLVEGKTWTTTWDNEERRITVTSVEGAKAQLEAVADGQLRVAYTYDAAFENIGQISFFDDAGEPTFAVQPRASGENWTGEYVRWQLPVDVAAQGSLQPAGLPVGVSFTVPEEATDIWVSLRVTCASGAFSFGFGPSQGGGEGWGVSEACPYNETTVGPVIEDPEPGGWEGGMLGASPAAEGDYRFRILVRVLQETPFPGG